MRLAINICSVAIGAVSYFLRHSLLQDASSVTRTVVINESDVKFTIDIVNFKLQKHRPIVSTLVYNFMTVVHFLDEKKFSHNCLALFNLEGT